MIYPLLCDSEMAIRTNAVCCISRMANRSESIARKLVDLRVPEIILKELSLDRNNNVSTAVRIILFKCNLLSTFISLGSL